MPLPDFVAPMLAHSGEPFDSEAHLFEIKWDGVRALAFVEAGSLRLLTRRRNEITPRYPDLEGLARLPSGCVLDGELVVLDDHGRSDFALALSREQARSPVRVSLLARELPVHYQVFDVLYRDGESVMGLPFRERREILADLVRDTGHPRLRCSDGMIGGGLALFAEAVALGLEGLVAKRLESRYHPGRRSDDWVKIKRQHQIHCAILGFQMNGRDLRSLLVGTDVDGTLTYVGKVGSGLDETTRDRLIPRLTELEADAPLIPCDGESARWVRPGLYCVVGYLERSAAGMLRAPVFKQMLGSH